MLKGLVYVSLYYQTASMLLITCACMNLSFFGFNLGAASKRFGIDGDREAVPLTLEVVYNRVRLFIH